MVTLVKVRNSEEPVILALSSSLGSNVRIAAVKSK